MQNNDFSNDKVDEIVNIITGCNDSQPVPRYSFDVEKTESGLVFELSDSTEEDIPTPSKKENGITFEVVPENKPSSEEFSVPEDFTIDKKYENSITEQDSPRIHTTYIPRFTGASERYRMSPTPRSVSAISSEVKAENDIDPTAEIDSTGSTVAVKTVNTSGAPDPDEVDSATRVFKFATEKSDATEINSSSIEEKNDTEVDASPTGELEEPSEAPVASRVYTIPDPVQHYDERKTHLPVSISKSGTSLIDAPDGVGDKYPGRYFRADYESHPQRESFKDGFLDSIMSLRLRLIASGAIALLLLVIEALFAFGVDIPLYLNMATIPGAMALIDAQFVFCLYLLAIPEVAVSFKSIIKGRVVPELYITASFVSLMAYTVVIFLKAPRFYPLFGLLFAIQTLAATVASYFAKSADFTAFRLMSEDNEKLAVDLKLTRTLECENAALDGRVEEHKSKTARMFRTVFISDFFKRVGKRAENSNNTIIILASVLGGAAVTALVSYFILDGAVSAAASFVLVLTLACPVMSQLLHKLPYFCAQRHLSSNDAVVIGEAAINDYSKTDVVTFKDTEVFGEEDVNLQRIMLYGRSDNLTKALRQMSALFMNVGGPLDRLFSDALDRKCSPADTVRVDSNGVCGEIDGLTVHAGTIEYMKSNGVAMPPEEDGVATQPYDSTRIMYAAENGEVYAKFYIRYSFSEEFTGILPVLEDEGITPLIYTSDPNITPELVRALTAGIDRIRILKIKDVADSTEPIYRKVSVGMVSLKDKTAAVNAILVSKKYAKLQSKFSSIELLATLIGGVMAVVLTLGGMLLLPSFAFSLWQVVWCGVLTFFSVKNFSLKDQ